MQIGCNFLGLIESNSNIKKLARESNTGARKEDVCFVLIEIQDFIVNILTVAEIQSKLFDNFLIRNKIFMLSCYCQ